MEISDSLAVVLLILFFFGVYLQVKIIDVVKKTKEVAWEAQIYHSIVVIVHFTIVLFFDAFPFAYIDHDITNFPAWCWICDIFRYIRMWGVFAISGHSLNVSIQKYIMIVHGEQGDSQRRKIAVIMLLVPLLFQILWTAAVYIRSADTITTDSDIQTCSTRTTYRAGFFCDFDTKRDYFRNSYSFYFITEMYCAMQATWTLIIYFNVIEVFIYWSIFRFTKRKIGPVVNSEPPALTNQEQYRVDSRKAAQEKDIRRAEVFAKFTAMITFCESLGHLSIALLIMATSFDGTCLPLYPFTCNGT